MREKMSMKLNKPIGSGRNSLEGIYANNANVIKASE
jgi:hypothetical protein